ncbi:MAG: HAD family phosphatase [Deltaproteobacteria bacterium]|nr:HAD family phosphatase [Deltaproteobacteria bacterium]
MLRAILFDFNGVLVDDEPFHLELFQKVLEEEGLELTQEDYYSKYLGLDDKGCFAEVLHQAGRTVDVGYLMRLITRKASYYEALIRQKGYPFFPGAIDLVREVGKAGLMLGIVSGALREEVEGALRQGKIEDLFKLLVTAEDVLASKPDPQGYQLGLEGLNSIPPLPDRLIHPHEVLVIEDSPAGVEAAQALGLPTLAVAQSYPKKELAMADAVAPSLAKLKLSEVLELYSAIP